MAGTHLVPKDMLPVVLGWRHKADFPNAPLPLALGFIPLRSGPSLGQTFRLSSSHLQKSMGNPLHSPVPDSTIPTPNPGLGAPLLGQLWTCYPSSAPKKWHQVPS